MELVGSLVFQMGRLFGYFGTSLVRLVVILNRFVIVDLCAFSEVELVVVYELERLFWYFYRYFPKWNWWLICHFFTFYRFLEVHYAALEYVGGWDPMVEISVQSPVTLRNSQSLVEPSPRYIMLSQSAGHLAFRVGMGSVTC